MIMIKLAPLAKANAEVEGTGYSLFFRSGGTAAACLIKSPTAFIEHVADLREDLCASPVRM